MGKVITYNLCEDLIDNVSSYILEHYAEHNSDLSRLAVVFAGKRPALFLRRALAQKIKNSFYPPRIFSMEEFISFIVSKRSAFRQMSSVDASYLIFELSKKYAPEMLKEGNRFSEFYPWAGEIISFIDQIDMENISPDRLKNITSSAEIGYDVPESVNAMLRKLNDIRGEYHGYMMKNNVYSTGLLYKLAGEFAADTELAEFDETMFCGLFFLHKTEKDVIKPFYDKGRATLFFQGGGKQWDVLRKLGDYFSFSIEPQHDLKQDYKLNLYSGYDTHSQVLLAREILKKTGSVNKTAIIVPDADTLIPLLSGLGGVEGDMNVSLGYPLRRSSIYSLVEQIFKAQSTKREDQYYTKDYLRAISHPLAKNIKFLGGESVCRVIVHKIEEMILGLEKSALEGSLFLRIFEVQDSEELYKAGIDALERMNIGVQREQLKEIVAGLHRLLFLNWENVSTLDDFCKALEELVCKLAAETSISSYPLNNRVMESFLQIIQEFRVSRLHAEGFDKEDIFRIFTERVSGEMIPFRGSPLKGLQVLGVLESRNLNFENVMIMDLNESVLPKLKLTEPLIPAEVMSSAGIERRNIEEEIQKYHFMRLVSSARNVHLIYCENKEREKSRFIEELIWNAQKETKSLDIIAGIKAGLSVNIMPERQAKTKTENMVRYLKSLNYSASKVNTYLDCPAKFYFRYVLGLKEKKQIKDELEGADVGIFIHRILFGAFRQFIGKKPVLDNAFRDNFVKLVDDTFNKELAKRMKSDAFLLKEVIDYKLRKFVESEKERPVKEIVALEKSLKGLVSLGETTYNFEAVVDRIDRLVDESILIIDYKTGGSDQMPKNLEPLERAELTRELIKKKVISFQLPIYLHLVKNNFKDDRIDAGLYDLRTSELKRFCKDSDEASNKMNICMNSLEYMMNEITSPDVPFMADETHQEHCLVCPFFYACRN